MEPSVAKNLIKYDLNLKAVKFGNDKMWTFPWSKRENVQHFYFSRFEREKYFVLFFPAKTIFEVADRFADRRADPKKPI